MYDWDVLKRHQEQGPQGPMPPVGGGSGVGGGTGGGMLSEGDNDGEDSPRGTALDLSGVQASTGGVVGGAVASRLATGGGDTSRATRGADEPEVREQPPPIRSIISSIRCVTIALPLSPTPSPSPSYSHSHNSFRNAPNRHSLFGSSKTGSNGGSGKMPNR